MTKSEGMSLPDRLLVVVIVLLVVPFLTLCVILFMNYYFWDTSQYSGKEDIRIPQWLRPELTAVMENDTGWIEQHPLPERSIMLLTDQDGNFIYTGFDELVDLNIASFSGTLPEFVTYVLGFMENERVALSLYSYRDRWGLMAYLINRDSLPQILSRWLGVLAVIYFVACLFFPIYISTRLIMQLRRSVRRLEEAARQVQGGNYDFDLGIPPRKDELQPLTEAFGAMQVQLREEQAQKSRFLMAISHDLKTPLTSVKGYLEAIEDGMAGTPEKLAEYVDIMQKKSRLLEQRIDKLIDFARMDTDTWRQKSHQSIPLRNFLDDLVRDFQREALLYGRTFRHSLEIHGALTLSGDPELLYRAFENILGNALSYTDRGDLIELSAVRNGSSVLICIRDSGPGIPEKDRVLIFEPFFRGDTGRNRTGMGLGLPSAASVFKSHGGSISCSGEGDDGTEFVIILPVENPEI